MDTIIARSNQLVLQADRSFVRFLYNQIQWDWRLIGIRGFRGVGKTTLMLQRMQEAHPVGKAEAIFLSLDNLYFMDNRLWDTVDALQAKGYRYFFLDEVHKYPDWAREVKNIYDAFTDVKIVFTGSSIIELNKLDVDLSRRAVLYDLPVLSFREYLALSGNIRLPALRLDEILVNHLEIALDIVQKIKPLQHLPRYWELGCYPYFIESPELYSRRLTQTIQLVVETDLAFVEGIPVRQTRKILQLLQVVAQSVPFSINVSKVAERIQIERNTLLKYLHFLEKAAILAFLRAPEKGLSTFQKPEKVYLDNPNLAYTLSPERTDKGNLRETFLFNQLRQAYPVHFTPAGDFLVNHRYVLEAGGKGKTFEQIKNEPQAWLALDDIETGHGNRIPLWLFGLLY
ncbi:MAG: ATP-binding protein [Haliscomenobacteraceae bacterium CHB4]|nr:ATP-binding protein [Haliscomenobacteraceae bacterium CHB4]